MSYRIPRWGFISQDQQICVAYTLQGGTDFGAQFAQAIPEQAMYVKSLVSTDHTVESHFINKFTYYFWVRSESGPGAWFALSGGGGV